MVECVYTFSLRVSVARGAEKHPHFGFARKGIHSDLEQVVLHISLQQQRRSLGGVKNTVSDKYLGQT